MPDNFDGPDSLDALGVFPIPASPSWQSTRVGLVARLDAQEPGQLIELGLTIGHSEVAWVTIYRSIDDVITASGPCGPYESANHSTWSWGAVDEAEQPARSTRIAQTVVAFLRSLDGIPENHELAQLNGVAHFRVATPMSGFVNREPRWDSYREHRTGAQIDHLLHYGHSIPMARGHTLKYVDEHFPGWTWSDLLEVLKAAGVLVGRAGAPPRCHPTVKAIHFTDSPTWAVEWLSGEITRSG